MQQETVFDEYATYPNYPKRYAVNLVNVRLVKEKRIGYLDKEIKMPDTAVKIAMNLLNEADREHFLVMFMDVKQKINGVQIISMGTISEVLAPPREVFKGAILAGASGIICVHNHPSGDVTPSESDKLICQNLIKAGKLLSIPVLDFIIVGPGGEFFSFKRHSDLIF
ncbi:JAB domain-containing protein [Moorella naiadis]|uniref:JAB domain-containing protein n=1 Tax=Moorella naiadis (nom. illeg.) TaxID=3093670 RepID=UPI003D9CB9A9